MSFTAVQAVRNAKRAIEEQKRQLELAVDADVQKLRNRADELMMGIPDKEGYYSLLVDSAEVEYPKPEEVINRFYERLVELQFIVPQVKCKKALRGNKKTFLIRFRANEEAIRQAEIEDVDSDVPSSGNSSAS